MSYVDNIVQALVTANENIAQVRFELARVRDENEAQAQKLEAADHANALLRDERDEMTRRIEHALAALKLDTRSSIKCVAAREALLGHDAFDSASWPGWVQAEDEPTMAEETSLIREHTGETHASRLRWPSLPLRYRDAEQAVIETLDDLNSMARTTVAAIAKAYGCEVDDPLFLYHLAGKIAEEGGEALAAYGEVSGWARKAGTWEHFDEECADTIISTWIAMVANNRDLPKAIRAKHAKIMARGFKEQASVCEHGSLVPHHVYVGVNARTACPGPALSVEARGFKVPAVSSQPIKERER